MIRLVLLLSLSLLGGCGLAAAPCRVGSAALKVVPLVGPAAAPPTHASAGALAP